MPEYTLSTFTTAGAQAFNPTGVLTDVANTLGLSQAIVIPPNASLIVTSGQCGFKENTDSFPADINEEVMLAFANAERTLKEAGVADGWKQVYQLTTYAPSLDDEWLAAVQAAKEKHLGLNRPAWTGVTVPSLYGGARLEMTIYAFVPAAGGRASSERL
ncbi:Endoribonuclease L-PSP/chorismate mutase-like protein [Aspergillus pseudodeflectus]|uniref:Endoribonuclease L-PSP/chorismate mutase-like protein n=1 Tax=Aspergillus pseudodeflectus TaxID=176178 RepID=A0ABR4KHG9_9EURO